MTFPLGEVQLRLCRKCGRPEGEVVFEVEATCTRRMCQECRKAARRKRYNEHPSGPRAYTRAYRARNRQAVNERARIANAERRAERARLLVSLKSKPCVGCRSSFPYFVMDFDHLDPSTKIAAISSLRMAPIAKLLGEIQKCDLVCRNCHALRTHGPKTKSEDSHPHRRRNQNRLNALKVAAPCTDCGHHFAPCQMDFDHVSGQKVKPVSQMTGGSWEAIEREIAKCDLVCANCHRVRTQGAGLWG